MSDQHGWVLMDAVWSSVVVVLAFMATFMALENGNKTATKDVVKTSAYDVAQNELNGLRELGVQNINSLLAKNNASNAPTSPSKTVMLGGEQYKIWYKAYYVSGLGDNSLDACGGTFVDDGSGAAKYIYMKVTVQYPGITFSGSTPSSPLPTLDAYFSPEGGDTNANTGTLRVYTLNSTNVPYVGTTVSLEATGVGMNYSTVTKTTGSTGCALFTGLPRGSYNINVSTGLYDLYMNNPTGGTDVTPINLPARAAMSRDIHLENAVRVTPDVYTDTGIKVNPGATTTSDLIGEGSAAVPVNWIARSSKIIQTSGEDFTTLPGSSYNPHTFLGASNQDLMYPDAGGYDLFAGPCDINKPASIVHIPTTGNSTWAPGGTYKEAGANPRLIVPQLRTQFYADPATASLIRNRAVTSGTGKLLIKLIGASGSTATSTRCGWRPDLFNNWERTPGAADGTGYLTDDQMSLPYGRYAVCARATATWQDRPSILSSTWTSRTATKWVSIATVDLNTTKAQQLDFFGASSSTTDCNTGASSLWTG